MTWTDYIPQSIKSGAQAGLDALKEARKKRVLARRIKAQENAEKQIENTYGELKLPHDHTTEQRLEATLGFQVGEETEAKFALAEKDPERLHEILKALGQNSSTESTTRSDVLQSAKGADCLVEIASKIKDPKDIFSIETIFLQEIKSKLPHEAAIHLENTDWGIVNSRFAHQPQILRDINIYKALEEYFIAKSEYLSSDSANNEAQKTRYENAVIDLAELSIDPDSRDILNSTTSTPSGPARSKHKNFLDQMKARGSSYFEKALHRHLENEGLLNEINNLRQIIANPIENSEHTLVKDPNRSGLRMILANDILRTSNHRLKSDSISVGVLGRLTGFISGNNLEKIDISTQDLVDIYGQDNYDRYLSNRTGYEFRLDNFIVDLYSGSTGLNTNNPNDPLINTKAGAVRQLVEVFSVIKLRIDRESDPTKKKTLVKQQELLSQLIKNSSSPNSSLVPHGVYMQIQHTLNNETGAVLHSLLPLSESMKLSTIKAEVIKQKERLERKHPDARTSQLLQDLEYLEQQTGLNDPKAFTTVIGSIVSEQSTLTTNLADSFLDIVTGSNQIMSNVITSALDADPKGNGLARLFEESLTGTAKRGSTEELLANIFIADQRESRAKFDEENLGTISSLCLSESKRFNQAMLIRTIADGDINQRSIQYDESGTERKIVGIAHIFAKIDSSRATAAVKEDAKERVLEALGIDITSLNGSTILTNIKTLNFAETLVGANSFNAKQAVENIQSSEARTLDTIKAFHNVVSVDKQSSPIFINAFFKQFTAEQDMANIQETLSIVNDAFNSTNQVDDFDQRLSQMKDYIKGNSGKGELADSFDVFNFHTEQDGQGFGQLVNQLLRHWGFDQLAEIISRLLKG